ncbi:MAG TPA: hypothetical protein VJO16_21060 [Candidatus Acidoferrum sp.]|nr:hypothetical protein [Candidatus Acidoferrum sp.]
MARRVSSDESNASKPGNETAPADLGPNNERLAEAKPELVNALRELALAPSPPKPPIDATPSRLWPIPRV